MKKFELIFGSDILTNFHNWEGYEEIISKNIINIYPRLGYDIKEDYIINFDSFNIINAPKIEMSSTLIRDRVLQNKRIDFFLPQIHHQNGKS